MLLQQCWYSAFILSFKKKVLDFCPDLCAKQSATLIYNGNDLKRNNSHRRKEQSFSVNFYRQKFYLTFPSLGTPQYLRKYSEWIALSARLWLTPLGSLPTDRPGFSRAAWNRFRWFTNSYEWSRIVLLFVSLRAIKQNENMVCYCYIFTSLKYKCYSSHDSVHVCEKPQRDIIKLTVLVVAKPHTKNEEDRLD